MKTNIKAVDAVWKVLKDAGIPALINGKIYKFSRALNSRNEDIVINALPITEEIPQRCYVNVNVYVNNLSVKINGQTDNTIPDLLRLDELTNSIIGVLEEVTNDDYYFSIGQHAVLSDDSISQYYSNIRIEFYFIY